MLRHLFKIIWNKKKENFLLISEMFVSFLVIFAIFSLIVYYYQNYRQPLGFDHIEVWAVNFQPPVLPADSDSMLLFHENLKKAIRSFPEVKDVTYTGNNTPFSMNSNNDEIRYKNESLLSNYYVGEDNYASLLNLPMTEGRWFNRSDDGARIVPVVLNQKLKQRLFANEDAVGKIVTIGGREYRVTGVSADMKFSSEYQDVEYGLFARPDTGWFRYGSTLFVKVKPGSNAVFEGKLYKMLSQAVGTSVEIEHFDEKLRDKNKLMKVPLLIAIIVAGFLIINVALGLFGVLWYNINKRKAEIGLRRAVGAAKGSVFMQLVGEAMVLSTISLALGFFFAVQFPLLNIFDLQSGIYIIAICLSAIFIYLLVLICAVYPGRQAAEIFPAMALHEE